MARPTSEACASLVLSTGALRPTGYFGHDGSCVWTFTTYAGEHIPVALTFGATPAPHVELRHNDRQPGEKVQRYRVELRATPQPFGGVRWWFICPATGRRTTKLFLPFGGDRFACRQAYRLGYASQRVGPLDRIDRRAARLYRALSGPTPWRDGLPPQPRWMRWPTYSRRALELRACMEAFDMVWIAGVTRRWSQAIGPADRA
jgi:hypothetical protein